MIIITKPGKPFQLEVERVKYMLGREKKVSDALVRSYVYKKHIVYIYIYLVFIC